MFDSLKNILFEFQSRNPFVYDTVLNDVNIVFVKQTAETQLQRVYPASDFTDVSFEILYPLFSSPNNDPTVSLADTVNNINNIWVRELIARGSVSQMNRFWKQTVAANYNINPEAIERPLATSIKGKNSIYLLPQGIGSTGTSGRVESTKLSQFFS